MGDPLPGLERDLGSGDAEVREQAACSLAEQRDLRAGPLLVRALRDSAPSVRIWAAYGLAQLQRPEDRPALRQALAEDRSATVRLWAAYGLIALGERAEAATLLSFLDDESLDVRNNAAEALLSLADPDLVRAPLERRLSSSAVRTRAWAAGVLHRLGHPKALEIWRRALASQEARLDAAVVAHHLGDPSVARELLRLLGRIPLGELEAPVPSAGELPMAEVLSRPLLELDLEGLLTECDDDEDLRSELLLLLCRAPSIDPDVLGQVHLSLAAFETRRLAPELATLIARSAGADRPELLAGICGYLPELVLPALESMDAKVREPLLAAVTTGAGGQGERAWAFAQLAELLRASPWGTPGGVSDAAKTLDEDEEETHPGVTAVDVPVVAQAKPALTPADLPEGPHRDEGPPPPSAAQAALRALCVGALLRRWTIEQAIARGDLTAERAAKDARDIVAWLRSERLSEALSPLEADLLNSEAGAWSDDERADAAWTAEALAVLLWALGRGPLPAADAPVEPAAVLGRLPGLETTAGFCRPAALRGAAELASQREAWELWRWRARAEVAARNEGGSDAAREDCHRAAARLRQQGLLAATASGDFPFRGRAFQRIDEVELAAATRLSLERHRAFHWLSLGGRWDEVATERG